MASGATIRRAADARRAAVGVRRVGCAACAAARAALVVAWPIAVACLAVAGLAAVSPVVAGGPPVTAPALSSPPVGPAAAPGPLDLPSVDAAIVPAGGGAPDRILVVRPRSGGSLAHLELLAPRGGDWAIVDRVDVAGSADASSDPWLVGLSPDRFVVVVGGGLAPSTFRLVDVVGARIVPGPSASIAGPVDGATTADLEGDGTPDLVVAGRVIRSGPPGDACPTEISVFDGSSLALSSRFRMGAVRVAGATVVRVPGQAGPVLVAPVGVRCDTDPAETAGSGDLLAVRLADGVRVGRVALGPADDRPATPIAATVGGRPVVITVDGERTVAIDPASLAVTAILGDSVRPVAVGPPTDGVVPIVLVQLVGGEPDALRIGALARDASGAVVYVDNGFRRSHVEIARWGATIPRHGTGVRWPAGGSVEIPGAGCPVVLAPTIVARCPTQPGGSLAVGPAWVGSRPLGILAGTGGPRLLVATSLTWAPGGLGLVAPSPWPVAATAGGWRGGPSAPFALAQLPADRLLAGGAFDQPHARLEPPSGPGTDAVVATGPTGDRVLVRPAGPGGGGSGTTPAGSASQLSAFLSTGSRPASLGRIAVPAASLPGAADGAVRFGLPADAAAGPPRWSVDVAVADDWGQVSDPARVVVTERAQGARLVVDPPALSLPWPFGTELIGSAEPGALVRLANGSSVVADAEGRFRLPVSLPPWPQELEVVATDPSGAREAISISAMGVLDPRRVPTLAALGALAVVGVVIGLLLEARRSARGGRAGRPTLRMARPAPDDPGDPWSRTSPAAAEDVDVLEGRPTIEDLDRPP